jgi:hypothetical protein
MKATVYLPLDILPENLEFGGREEKLRYLFHQNPKVYFKEILPSRMN